MSFRHKYNLNKGVYIKKLLSVVVMVLALTLIPAQTAHSDAKVETLPTAISKQVSMLSTDSNKIEKKVAVKAQEKPVEPTVAAPTPEPAPEPIPVPEPAPAAPTCAENQWVRADNGQCIDKPVEIVPVAVAPVVVASVGSHTDLMAQVGIAPSDYSAVEYVINHESGWRVEATNPSSGACGLGQEFPCGKSGCTMDAVCQLAWANNYAIQRYGGWQGAYAFWIANQWW